MKKIVITGGTGLIGTPLIARLGADGHQITVLSRNPQKYKESFPTNVIFAVWDAQSVGDWGQVIDGADVVINLASENIAGDNFLPDRWSEKKRHKILQSRLDSSQAIVKAIESAENKPDLLLQASAIGYYGPHGDEWINEQSDSGQDFPAQVAVDWEKASDRVEELGVRRILMRIGLVLSTEGGPLTRIQEPFKFFVGGPYGNGRQWYSWIHIDDLVQAIRFLIAEEGISGPVNLVSPEPVMNKQFAKALGRAMNRPSFIPVPSFAMRLLAGDAATLVLGGQRVSSKYIQDQGFQFRFANIDRALQDLIQGT